MTAAGRQQGLSDNGRMQLTVPFTEVKEKPSRRDSRQRLRGRKRLSSLKTAFQMGSLFKGKGKTQRTLYKTKSLIKLILNFCFRRPTTQ